MVQWPRWSIWNGIKFSLRKTPLLPESFSGRKGFAAHRRPKLTTRGVILFLFFCFFANAQRNVTSGIYHYTTIEFDFAKRDSRLAAYGGVWLQRFEFIKVCMGSQRFCWKTQFCLYFVNKIDLPFCCVVFFLFASSSGRSNAISASCRSVGFHC